MKTQEELRADFQRYLDADMLDEAAALELLEPLSDEEWHQWHATAPDDQEPLSKKAIARLRAARERQARRRAAPTNSRSSPHR